MINEFSEMDSDIDSNSRKRIYNPLTLISLIKKNKTIEAKNHIIADYKGYSESEANDIISIINLYTKDKIDLEELNVKLEKYSFNFS